jgi:hypothetical protein
MDDNIYSLLIDLEIDVACLLDALDDVTAQDIETIQDKISSLRAEYRARAKA